MEKMKVEHEARIAEMEVEHKAHITELEIKTPGAPPLERKSQVAELQGCATMIDNCLVETYKMLDEAVHTWTTMEEMDSLVEVHFSLQQNQQKFDELVATTKDLSMLEHMMKMKESTKLQTEL